MSIIDRVQGWFGRGTPQPAPNRPEETPARDVVEWAQPLASQGQVRPSDLATIHQIERWTKENKPAVLAAVVEIPNRTHAINDQVYRLSNQVEDGAVVARALKLYQGVLQGQDRLTPRQRETVYLNMLRMHQDAEKAHAGYAAYVNGQGSAEEKLLGDMSTVNPGQDKWRNAESIYALFEVARKLPENERPLFLSIFETHGYFPNRDHSNKIQKVWEHVCRQPDKTRATAHFLELRQLFAERHPPRGLFPNEELDSADNCTGFACRVLGEENEGLPIYTEMWRRLDCDPTGVSASTRVLRERIATGQAELTLKHALAVHHGVVASRALTRFMAPDATEFLAGHFSAEDWSVVAQALAKVGERSADSAVKLVEDFRANPTPARREQLMEVCTHAILYDGDANLDLDEHPSQARGITVTENRVQVGQVSLRRRNLETKSRPAG